jgi:hypothetical protein
MSMAPGKSIDRFEPGEKVEGAFWALWMGRRGELCLSNISPLMPVGLTYHEVRALLVGPSFRSEEA